MFHVGMGFVLSWNTVTKRNTLSKRPTLEHPTSQFETTVPFWNTLTYPQVVNNLSTVGDKPGDNFIHKVIHISTVQMYSLKSGTSYPQPVPRWNTVPIWSGITPFWNRPPASEVGHGVNCTESSE